MNERPILTKEINIETFKNYYYLKSELVTFCKENNLPTTGSKVEITNRIIYFLQTGKIISSSKTKTKQNIEEINENTIIGSNVSYSEKHRKFFKDRIGKSFTFNVPFQRWLKNNSNKTYGEAINAYYEIIKEKKIHKAPIDKQFEYNTYIRDFFNNNKNKSLKDAIVCWKYKKSLPGDNHYDNSDLIVLNKN